MLNERIVRSAIKGDAEAFVVLLRSYEAPLYRVAYSYLRNEHDAKDAIGELSYRSYRSIGSVREPRYVGTWLTKMMMNICRDMLRKQKRELPSLNVEDESLSYEQHVDIELLDALQALEEEQQALIYMKYVEDQSNAAIADVMKLPEGTVKSRLHYTLRKLRNVFREEGLK